MRPAFTMLGILSALMFLGMYLAFRTHSEKIINPSTPMPKEFKLYASLFGDNESIPSEFTCDGENVSPELRIENIPSETKSLVLLMDDPDIPEEVKTRLGIQKFDHWTLFNIPPDTTVIPQGATIGELGLTSRGEAKYSGPCPPDREHRYFFRLYALPGTLSFVGVPTQKEVEEAAHSMSIASTTFMGRYKRLDQ